MLIRGRLSTAGFAFETVLIIVCLVGGSQLVPNFRPANWFKKGPPTAELVAAQAAAADATARAAGLQARLDATARQDAEKKDSQVSYSHEMVTGAIEANSHAPDSTEKAITDSFLQRADIGLNSAIGKLPPELRAEVVSIVAQLRSGDQEKIRAANAMIAEKDKQLSAASEARVKLEADHASVQKQLVTANAEKDKKAAVETKLTAQVVSYSDKAYAKEKEAGSLAAFGDNVLEFAIVITVVALVFGALYLYRRMRSVGPVTLGNIIADIRAGTPPTVAFDTHLNPSLHPAVQAAAASVTATPNP